MVNRLELLRIFCAAAESASFREAAMRLGVSPQVVTRAVRQLEVSTGEVLFRRNTRQIQISAAGERFAERARQALAGVDGLFVDTGGPAGDLAGTVRITSPTSMGRRYVLPALFDMMRAHPTLTVDLRPSNELTDVIESQIDVGVRIGLMPDSQLVARKVADVSLLVVGAPSLIERVGKPGSIDALAGLPCNVLIDRKTGRPWPWIFGQQQWTPSGPAFITHDPEIEVDAALAGIGFSQLTSFNVVPHIRAGRLAVVLVKAQQPRWPLYVYRAQRSPVPARVRKVFDTLAERLGDADFLPAAL